MDGILKQVDERQAKDGMEDERYWKETLGNREDLEKGLTLVFDFGLRAGCFGKLI